MVKDDRDVLGAPDEPIRRQRQMVGHLGNIEDELNATSAEIDLIIQTLNDIHGWMQSSRYALWAIVIILLIHVIRHW